MTLDEILNRYTADLEDALNDLGPFHRPNPAEIMTVRESAKEAIKHWAMELISEDDTPVIADGSVDSALVSYNSGRNHLRFELKQKIQEAE